MKNYTATNRRAGIVLTLAATAVIGSTIAQAGPGCMSDQRYMNRAYYPHSPMGPHPAYGPQAPYGRQAPYGYYAAPAPVTGTMAPYYQPPMTAQRANPDATGPEAGTQTVAADNTVTVRIVGMRFKPAQLTVKPGTTVTWLQESRMPHTVTGKTDELRSNTLNAGQQFSYTFDAVGSYAYACDFHPAMQGKVIVEADGLGI